MRRVSDVLLGIIASLAGFVDVGQLVYALEAGGRFGYRLMWPILLGTLGIAVFAEMAGRVAAVAQIGVFDAIRTRYRRPVGAAVLAAALLVAVVISAAELGGLAVLLQMLTGWNYRLAALASGAFCLACLAVMSFNLIERIFGLLSLTLLVFVAASLSVETDWRQVAFGFVPTVPDLHGAADWLVYAYFAVGLTGTVMLPCQIYFYAAGVIEDEWQDSELRLNRVTVALGFAFGAVVAACLVALGAVLFQPAGIFPQVVSPALVTASIPLGVTGFWIAWTGLAVSIAAAAITSVLAGAYALSQFAGWAWGKNRRTREVKRFAATWIVVLILAMGMVLTGIRPLDLVDDGVMLAVATIPVAFWPVLATAGDPAIMGEHANGRLASVAGWAVLTVSCIPALLGIPLLLLTHGGIG